MAGAVAIGAIACALLVANNLRDIPTDSTTGKRTLAVVIGAARSRQLYAGLIALAFILAVAVSSGDAVDAAGPDRPPAGDQVRPSVVSDAVGPALIPVLKGTGLTELVYAVGLAIGLALGS